jgi:hypothetical protein
MIDVLRATVVPAGLVKRNLRSSDVLQALWESFLGKCYLCESLVRVGSFEVDHRVPVNHDATREFDWTNLFPICDGCNKRRPKKHPEGGLLDPACGQSVEAKLEQRIVDRPGDERGPYFAARDTVDRAAVNTAAELDHIHNDHAIKAADLRSAIMTHQGRVFRECLRYLNEPLMEQERQEVRERLRRLLSRRAPYTALTRAELAALGPAIVELFD